MGCGKLKLCWKEPSIDLWALNSLKLPRVLHTLCRKPATELPQSDLCSLGKLISLLALCCWTELRQLNLIKGPVASESGGFSLCKTRAEELKIQIAPVENPCLAPSSTSCSSLNGAPALQGSCALASVGTCTHVWACMHTYALTHSEKS